MLLSTIVVEGHLRTFLLDSDVGVSPTRPPSSTGKRHPCNIPPPKDTETTPVPRWQCVASDVDSLPGLGIDRRVSLGPIGTVSEGWNGRSQFPNCVVTLNNLSDWSTPLLKICGLPLGIIIPSQTLKMVTDGILLLTYRRDLILGRKVFVHSQSES